MPTHDALIKKLEERIVARKKKLATLAVVQKLHAAIEADEVKAAKLKSDLAKKRADRSRIDETHAKTVIGAGVLLLPPAAVLRIMHEVCDRLIERDRKWIGRWFKDRGVNIDGALPEAQCGVQPCIGVSPIAASQSLATDIDPIGEVFEDTFRSMSEGSFGLLGPELLAQTKPQNRAVLENWFAQLDRHR